MGGWPSGTFISNLLFEGGWVTIIVFVRCRAAEEPCRERGGGGERLLLLVLCEGAAALLSLL